MKEPVNPKQIIPDPETVPIVRRIFEAYASGIGIVKIWDMLTREMMLYNITGQYDPLPHKMYIPAPLFQLFFPNLLVILIEMVYKEALI